MENWVTFGMLHSLFRYCCAEVMHLLINSNRISLPSALAKTFLLTRMILVGLIVNWLCYLVAFYYWWLPRMLMCNGLQYMIGFFCLNLQRIVKTVNWMNGMKHGLATVTVSPETGVHCVIQVVNIANHGILNLISLQSAVLIIVRYHRAPRASKNL